MPKRFSRPISRKVRPSRKEIKQRFIKIKNRCNDPFFNDGSGGVYYSQHVRSPIMSWMDIFFVSKFHKGRYFACALTTLEHLGLENVETQAWEEGDALFPGAEIDVLSRPAFVDESCTRKSIFVTNEAYKQKREWCDAREKELNLVPQKLRPHINIDRNYWYPAIGFHASLNTPSLSTKAITDMIQKFRDMGEPIKHGSVWIGEEVTVVPQRLIEAYDEQNTRDAQPRSD